MKHAKKLLALALVFAMALALAVPAFAAEGDTTIGGVTVPPFQDVSGSGEDTADHVYTVYQIFKGEFEDNLLTEIQWGSDVDGQKLVAALAGDEYIEAYNALEPDSTQALTAETNPFKGIAYNEDHSDVSADAVARVLAKMNLQEDSIEARAFAQVVDNNKTGDGTAVPETGVVLPETGYYLMVDTMTAGEGVTGARNLYILSAAAAGANYMPKAKTDVPKLDKQVANTNDSTGTTEWSDTAADYDIGDHVPFVLSGTVSNRYNDFKVYKYAFHDTLSDGLTLDYSEDNKDALQVYINGTLIDASNYTVAVNGQSFSVTFSDLKTVENPVVSSDSVIRVLYTATLNENAVIGGIGNENKAHLEFSNDPNKTDDGTTGKTPDDIVTVFTFKLAVSKKGDDPANPGAEPQPLDGAVFGLYKLVLGEDGTTIETLVKTLGLDEEGANTNINEFSFDGLDAGKYMLREETAPAGYNKAEDMYFEIVPNYNEEGKLVGLSVQEKELNGEKVYAAMDKSGNLHVSANGEPTFPMSGNVVAGAITADILNLKGLQLPATGGIGTTIFYVVGGILLVGAAVVLITKKRMSSAE